MNKRKFHHRLWLRILADQRFHSSSQEKSLSSSINGFTLPLSVVIGFMLLLGGLALASRSNWSIFGNAFQGQAWEAKDAAEIGMNVIVNQLNQPRNRWLNVVRKDDPDYASEPNTSGTADTWLNRNSSQKVLELRMNPCLTGKTADPSSELPFYGNSSGGIDPSGAASKTYGKWYINNTGTISSTQGTADRSFRLVKISRQPYAGNVPRALRDINGDGVTNEQDQYLSIWRDRPENPSGVGKVTIQVEGQSYLNGRVVSSVILEKEFELTPKCCGVPFGGSHGNVAYEKQATGTYAGTSICLASMLGLGLLGGSAETNTGSITIRGRATDIEDEEGDPVNPIYCLASNKAGCAVNVNASDISVAVVDTTLRDAYTYAAPRTGVTLPSARSMTPGILEECSRTGSTNRCPSNTPDPLVTTPPEFTYCIDPTNGNSGVSCGNTAATVVNGGAVASQIPTFCSISSNDKELHCNITSLSYSKTLVFLTGARSITLYFPSAGTVIAQSGNGELKHCSRILPGSANWCSETKSDGTALSVTDLNFFGSNTALSPQQQAQMRGTADIALKFFMYFPTGQVELRGDATFEGILWTDDIVSAGNPTWIVPGSGLADVFGLMGMTGNTSGGADPNKIQPLLYDFVLRATDRYRWIGA